MNLVDKISRQQMKAEVPGFSVGDTVDVDVLITEGDKERIQVFNGTVIARSGGGPGETFSVRRMVQGEGVERTFLVHSPRVKRIRVRRRGDVRRAKLHYLRDRVGKGVRVKEKKEVK